MMLILLNPSLTYQIELPAVNYFHYCRKQVHRINYEYPVNEPGDSFARSNSGEFRKAQKNDRCGQEDQGRSRC